VAELRRVYTGRLANARVATGPRLAVAGRYGLHRSWHRFRLWRCESSDFSKLTIANAPGNRCSVRTG